MFIIHLTAFFRKRVYDFFMLLSDKFIVVSEDRSIMYQILEKKRLNATVTQMKIHAPAVAKKAQPGQFIILRTDAEGERIPLTVADYNAAEGSVTIIFQVVGATTEALNHMNAGDCLHDFVGPLGRATETAGLKRSPLWAVASDAPLLIRLPKSCLNRGQRCTR